MPGLQGRAFPVWLVGLAAVLAHVPAALARDWSGFTQTGKATVYADRFQNQKTASGERHGHGLQTAAPAL